MSVRRLISAAAFATLLIGSAAQAGVSLHEDFESYVDSPANTAAYGDSELNFSAFTKGFNVQAGSGSVDLIGVDDPWNLMTGYGSGFLDLDGTTKNGGILRTAVYAFDAGDLITLSFEASGNQRRRASDDLSFGFETAGGDFGFNNFKVLNDLYFFPAVGPQSLGSGSGPALTSGVAALAANSPWVTYSISFRATTAGSLSAFIGTKSADNYGPLVDDIYFTIAAVPEPSSWAMMITGFGLVGVMARRRRGVALAA